MLVPEPEKTDERALEQLERHLAVRLGKSICRNFCFNYHGLRVLAPSNLPPSGPAILVANHTSSLDPIILQATCPRLITWMMAAEYGSIFGLKWFFNIIQPIMVERTGRDSAAMRLAIRALESGKLLGLYPEGHIEKTREVAPFQTGVALIAMRTGLPVYPVYIDGGQRLKSMLEGFFVPQPCTVAYGPPVQIDRAAKGREGLEAVTAQIQRAVENLAALHQ